MNETLYAALAIAVIGIVTFALRALPFLIFGRRELPGKVRYLGRVLPPAIMTILVVYCMKGLKLTAWPFGLPELTAAALVIILQSLKNNMYLSIVAGTLYYMIALRLL